MLQLRDFIPQAEEHESCRDFAKAEEIYSKGIAALDHWRLFWHRSKARMELALQSEDAESQQKYFEKALDDVKKAVQKSDGKDARLWITYTKIEVALGNRAGAVYALENAKSCSKGDFTALAAELHEWNSALGPSAMEIYDEVKKNVSEAIAKISKYTEKDFKIRSQKIIDAQMPSRAVREGTTWVRCKDGVTRRCTKEGLLDLGEIKQILDPMGNILGKIGGTVDLKEMKLWIPKKR